MVTACEATTVFVQCECAVVEYIIEILNPVQRGCKLAASVTDDAILNNAAGRGRIVYIRVFEVDRASAAVDQCSEDEHVLRVIEPQQRRVGTTAGSAVTTPNYLNRTASGREHVDNRAIVRERHAVANTDTVDETNV